MDRAQKMTFHSFSVLLHRSKNHYSKKNVHLLMIITMAKFVTTPHVNNSFSILFDLEMFKPVSDQQFIYNGRTLITTTFDTSDNKQNVVRKSINLILIGILLKVNRELLSCNMFSQKHIKEPVCSCQVENISTRVGTEVYCHKISL